MTTRALHHSPRKFSAFDLPAGFERVAFTIEVRGETNGCVLLTADAWGPWREMEFVLAAGGGTSRTVYIRDGKADRLPGPWSQSHLRLCGDRAVAALFTAFFRGEMALGWVADWIEEEPDDRVKGARLPWIEAHRLDPDPLTHFLTLMRCYRDKRKAKGRRER